MSKLFIMCHCYLANNTILCIMYICDFQYPFHYEPILALLLYIDVYFAIAPTPTPPPPVPTAMRN